MKTVLGQIIAGLNVCYLTFFIDFQIAIAVSLMVLLCFHHNPPSSESAHRGTTDKTTTKLIDGFRVLTVG